MTDILSPETREKVRLIKEFIATCEAEGVNPVVASALVKPNDEGSESFMAKRYGKARNGSG